MNGPSQEIDQKNMISAIALSVGILMIWQYFNPPPPPIEAPTETSVTTSEASKTPGKDTQDPGVAPPAEVVAVAAAPLSTEVVDNELQTVTVQNRDGALSHWILKNDQYATEDDAQGRALLELISGNLASTKTSGFLSPELQLTINGKLQKIAYSMERVGEQVIMRWADPQSNLRVERRLSLAKAQHQMETELVLRNAGQAPISYAADVKLQGIQDDANAQGSMFMPPLHMYESLCKTGGSFERLLGNDITENVADGESNTFTKDVSWAGIGTRYFLTAVYSPDGALKSCASSVEPPREGFTRFINLVGLGDGLIQPGETVTRKYAVFMGPKKLSELSQGSVSLEDAIDFGMFHVMCKPMLWFMHIFFGFVANWGIAIILLTVLVKLITMPLTIKQYRSMAAMKTVQPELKKLQDKYKDDKMRLQQEMMKLYKDNNVNPLAGCLPMIIMMPIYFALYRTIYSAVELYQAPFGLWITDLSVEDPTYITPLLLGVLMLIQMKLNPSAGDQAQQKIIMYVMPVMFTGMMLFLPSGLVVYILVNTVLGIIQQFYMYRKQGLVASKATS
ncbi:MAG: membrane protein insertase YidC [Bradymonadia bacterium]